MGCLALRILVILLSCTLLADASFKRRSPASSGRGGGSSRKTSPTKKPSDSSTIERERKDVELKLDPEVSSLSVFDKGLVNADLTYNSVLENHRFYHVESHAKRFPGKTLGYVTPWNNHGYDVVKVFTDKFDYISPVWLQVKAMKDRSNDITFELGGTHDIDQGWMEEVRSKAVARPPPKFVPRLIFEGFTSQDWASLLSSIALRKSLTSLLVDCINSYGFDGLVLEFYLEARYQVSQIGEPSRAQISLTSFTKLLADGIHEGTTGKEVILVLSPWEAAVPAEDVFEVSESIDSFSLMTYDFPSGARLVGSVAPLFWMEETLQRFSSRPEVLSKMMLGLNFYGNALMGEIGSQLTRNPQAVIAKDWLKILSEEKPVIRWESTLREHYAQVAGGQVVIFYPSLQSIGERLALAEKYGVGVSIWETGQGLEYFYDLF
eukprot:TRINITY_DN19441_c0_g1_i1.p1 TRINITY_DN19441_c0_g1~~TRINITY_DN19441_c0_g1_i1.p1  ORF type:complete len:435 (+),score=107.80 TRINITY_DN19441_c0_g1_i1:946-2250(+)